MSGFGYIIYGKHKITTVYLRITLVETNTYSSIAFCIARIAQECLSSVSPRGLLTEKNSKHVVL